MAEVLRRQAALVGDGADDRAGAHVLAAADADAELAHAVAGELGALGLAGGVLAAAVADAAATAVLLEAATALAAVAATAVAIVALAARRLLHQEVAVLRRRGQRGGDVGQRGVVLVGVGLDQLAEDRDLVVGERLGDGVHELRLARVVDLVDARRRHLVQGRLRRALDGAQQAALARGDEQQRLARAARAAGAADAVDVRLGVVGDVEVDHVADAVDVQAAGGDVGGHEDVQAAVLQLVDGALALVLRDVAVDGGGGEAAGAQLLGELLGLVLGAHEHDHRLELLDLQHAGEGVELVAVRGHQEALADVVRGARLRLDRDFLRVVEVLLRQAADRGRHGRGEQGDLLLGGGVGEDALDVFLEAHVQHLVGFVEDQESQVGDVQRALLQVVDDAARGAHDDLGAAAQAGELDAVGLAAVDRQHGDAAEVVGEGLEGVGDLERELAGRGEHERLGGADLAVDAGEDRQREGGGLAGAGLRQADDVAAAHQRRDGRGLDRRRRLVADLRHRGDDLVGQVQLVEAGALGLVVVGLIGLVGLLLVVLLLGLLDDGLRLTLLGLLDRGGVVLEGGLVGVGNLGLVDLHGLGGFGVLGVRGVLLAGILLGVLVGGGLLGVLLGGLRLLDGVLGVLLGGGVLAGVLVQLRTLLIAEILVVVTHVFTHLMAPVGLMCGASGRLVRGLVHRVLCIEIVFVGRVGPPIVSVRGVALILADLRSINHRRFQYVVECEGCAVVRAFRGYRFVVGFRRFHVAGHVIGCAHCPSHTTPSTCRNAINSAQRCRRSL